MLKTFPKTHITLAAAATVIVSAAVLMSPSADVEAKRMSYTVDLEQGLISGASSQEASTQAAAPEAETTSETTESQSQPMAAQADVAPEPDIQWQEFTIKSGDTLSTLFRKAGFNDGLMLSVIHGDGEADKLQRLYAGEDIRFGVNSEGELVAIELQRSLLESLKIARTEDGFLIFSIKK